MTITELETRYTELNDQLNRKLTSLLWLDKAVKLQNESQEAIDTEYDRISKAHSQYINVPNEEAIEAGVVAEHLRKQLYNIQIDTYLNDYLQVTLPTIRAIHQERSELTTLEQSLATNLQLLFDNDSEDPANYHNLTKMLQLAEQNDENMIQERRKIVKYIVDTVRPQFMQYNKERRQIQLESTENLEQKEAEIENFAKLLSSNQIETIDIMYSDLVKTWLKNSIQCDLLPGIILTLPLNWHDDPNLATVMADCQNIGSIVSQNQALVNVDTIRNITTEALISYIGSLQ